MFVPVMKVRPVRMGVRHRLMLVGMRVLHAGGKIRVGVGVMPIIVPVRVLVGKSRMRVDVLVTFPKEQDQRPSKERDRENITQNKGFFQEHDRQKKAKVGRAGKYELRAARSHSTGAADI